MYVRAQVCGLCSRAYSYGADLRKHLTQRHEQAMPPIAREARDKVGVYTDSTAGYDH